jgi:hypothetical protein
MLKSVARYTPITTYFSFIIPKYYNTLNVALHPRNIAMVLLKFNYHLEDTRAVD